MVCGIWFGRNHIEEDLHVDRIVVGRDCGAGKKGIVRDLHAGVVDRKDGTDEAREGADERMWPQREKL